MLKEIHTIPAPVGQPDWAERFNRKIDRNIRTHEDCEFRLPFADKMVSYIIDFNRLDYGDPWEEFNRIVWCGAVSGSFASGRINGYFGESAPPSAPAYVPEEFFRLMALYIASNMLSSVPWAVPFGQAEIDTMTAQAREVMDWYDDFRRYVPGWYVKSRADCQVSNLPV